MLRDVLAMAPGQFYAGGYNHIVVGLDELPRLSIRRLFNLAP